MGLVIERGRSKINKEIKGDLDTKPVISIRGLTQKAVPNKKKQTKEQINKYV